MELTSRLAAFVVGTPLVAVAAVLALAPPRVDLVVVNGTPAAVLVDVGGRPPERVEAGGALALEGLAAGRTRLVARPAGCADTPPGATGGLVDELTGDLVAGLGAPRPTYVWDVAASTSFVVVSRGYGDRARERGVEPFDAGQRRLFALPSAFVPGVDPGFPETARVTSGTLGTVRQALWTKAHADRAGKAEVVLLVDDGVGANLRLVIDGVDQAVIRGGRTLTMTGVTPGRHELRAVELNQDGSGTGRVYRLDALLGAEAFAPPAVWVWNVAGAQREYIVVSRVYGPSEEVVPPTTTMASPGELFRLPADFFPGMNSQLPDRTSRAGVLRTIWTPLAHERSTGPFKGSSETTLQGIQGLVPGFGEKSPTEAAPPAPR